MLDKGRGVLELAHAEVDEKTQAGLFRRKRGLPDFERGIQHEEEAKELHRGYTGQGPRRQCFLYAPPLLTLRYVRL